MIDDYLMIIVALDGKDVAALQQLYTDVGGLRMGGVTNIPQMINVVAAVLLEKIQGILDTCCLPVTVGHDADYLFILGS